MNDKAAAEFQLRENLRRDIQFQVEQFLLRGGSIDHLPSNGSGNACINKTWKPVTVSGFDNG